MRCCCTHASGDEGWAHCMLESHADIMGLATQAACVLRTTARCTPIGGARQMCLVRVGVRACCPCAACGGVGAPRSGSKTGCRQVCSVDAAAAEMRADSELLQTAADSCDGPCSLIFSRGYNLNTAVYLNPNNAVFSTRGSRVVGGNGPGAQHEGKRRQAASSTHLGRTPTCIPPPHVRAGEGLVLRPGQYDAPILLTSLQSFSSFALKVQVGACAQGLAVSTTPPRCQRPTSLAKQANTRCLAGRRVGRRHPAGLAVLQLGWPGV